MNEVRRLSRNLSLITFDCYGTLIDWETGIRDSLARLLRSGGIAWEPRFFDVYVRCEAEQERQPYRSYRDVLAATEAQVLRSAGLPPPSIPQLPQTVRGWLPFPDTVEALQRLKSRYRLGILSNVDRDLFGQTSRLLRVDFDVVVTAQDVQCYKPEPAHFLRLQELTGAAPGQHLHVAQSLYHDISPCNRLGIPGVWINRRNETNHGSAQALAQFPDLAAFADALL